MAGTLAAIWSTTRIVGEVFPYLLLWSSVLLLPAWIGVGVLVAGWGSRADAPWHRFGSRVLAGGLAALTVAAGWSMLRAPSPPLRSATDVTAAGKLTGHWLDQHDVERVRIALGDHDQWPLAAGLIDHLDGKGLAVTVSPDYVPLFGDQFSPIGPEDATVWLTRPDGTPPHPTEGLQRLGEAGGSVVWAGPGPPR